MAAGAAVTASQPDSPELTKLSVKTKTTYAAGGNLTRDVPDDDVIGRTRNLYKLDSVKL